ncbi:MULTISPECIES: hypothetical protein [Marinobacter]|nr:MULTISPECIES: hypothetical protein [Marinobacter]VVT01397.1 conserved hypothetical protein [Marinobacter salarius]VXC32366.1 hypothetical protein MARINON1_52693 [Marinobacter salarius]|tara:strand:+ start:1081 stop:2361 length:1281 start_codon:yes stop_codon:yes gene_type:complete
MRPYKYYAGLTSQVAFCATPLRLDSYNRCQFSCEYCFAATRQGYGRGEALQISNPKSLKERLERVSKGIIRSALDEMIGRNIPFQLGGMSDPFTKIEKEKGVTLEYLKILKDYNYPVIVSTKSDQVIGKDYLDVINGSNIYIRFSTTIVSPHLREKIDRGCPPLADIGFAASVLANENIPVCFRFQPIIPGHEKSFDEVFEVAKKANVKHISAEYLKCPIDANRNFGKSLANDLGKNPIEYYKELGAERYGREYMLPLRYRAPWLIEFANKARDNGVTFGFADNDLLLHSDGQSCCSASDLYLKKASFFNANIVALAKSKQYGDLIYFSDYLSRWIPESSVSTYLNSTARLRSLNFEESQWLQYLREMWLGQYGVFRPDYFDGLEKTKKVDLNGLPVYVKRKSDFVNRLETSAASSGYLERKVQLN